MLNRFEFNHYTYPKLKSSAELFLRTAHLDVYLVNGFELNRLCSLTEFRDLTSSICTLLVARALNHAPRAESNWAHISSNYKEKPKLKSSLEQALQYLERPGCAGAHYFGLDFYSKDYCGILYKWTPRGPNVLRTLEFINDLVYNTERHPVATAVALSSNALSLAVTEAIAELEAECGAIVPNKALITKFLGSIKDGCHLVVQTS